MNKVEIFSSSELKNEPYHIRKGISSSTIKTIAQSPALYKWQYIEKNWPQDKPAFAFGRLVHGLVLEPDSFSDNFIIVDASSRRGKIWTAAIEDNPDKDVVLISDVEKASAIAMAVRHNDEAMTLLDHAVFETSIFWDENGNPAKARPDIWQGHLRCVSDLKTTRNASPRSFARAAIDFGYHISAAWYRRGVEAVTGEPLDAWYWIAVETEAPYIVQVYHAPNEWLLYGDDCIDRALNKLDWCKKHNKWPGYRDGITDLELPGWVEFEGGLIGATEQHA